MNEAAIGTEIQQYRDHVTAAWDWSNRMMVHGFCRPWIVVRCRREECCTSIVRYETDGTKIIPEHTHRIRLEIR